MPELAGQQVTVGDEVPDRPMGSGSGFGGLDETADRFEIAIVEVAAEALPVGCQG